MPTDRDKPGARRHAAGGARLPEGLTVAPTPARLYHEGRADAAAAAPERSRTPPTAPWRHDMPQSNVLPDTASRFYVLSQAHTRSSSVGLRASDLPDLAPLARTVLHDLIDGSRSLYTHARPVMETLHAQIADTQSLVLLTDHDGVILHSIGDADFVEKANRVALCPGASWSENARGTNAIGTALAARQAVTVHGSEHFLRANHVLSCSCAPIVDPFGRLLGALDVSGDPRGFSPHTLALVKMSAQMIENHLFTNACADALRVRFHAHEEFVDSLFGGLAAFHPNGTLLAANRSAQFQLGGALDTLLEHGCDELFGISFARLAEHAMRAPGTSLPLTLPSGVRVLARCEFADARRGGVAPAATPAPDTRPAATPGSPPARTDAAQAITFATLDTGDARMAAICRCSCSVKPAPARNGSRARCTMLRRAPMARSWPSTARRCPIR
ncbi:MAG: Acetoin catabolism regulatory protein [Burkholderia plantarii]|nr:MAG: Acetoin catabolism regulatory protein [Burkholderia plantarii]